MEEILDYEGLIYSIISKYSKRYDRDDLYQVGMIGLIDAYKHYKSDSDTKFSTFAYYYILGEVNKYIRESSSLKISKDLIDVKKKVIRTRELMMQKLGREPTNLEVSLYLDIDEDIINNALIATDEVSSIDSFDMTKCFDMTSPEILDLKDELGKLSSEERRLIMLRYFNDMTQRETSDLLGMSQVQVSRSEAKILNKLKARL